MTDVTVIDSFLDKSDLEDLKGIVLSDYFPWYLNDGVSFPGDGEIQFTHTTFKDGDWCSSYTLGGLDIGSCVPVEVLSLMTLLKKVLRAPKRRRRLAN